MNRALVWRLILKDWYLSRATLLIVAAAGSLSIGILYLRTDVSRFLGLSTAFIVMILLSIMLPMQTVVSERKKQNLPFVMSLPVSPMEYTTAKILGNLSAFTVLWLALVIGVLGTIARAGAYSGVIPLALVASLAPFVAFCLLLAVAVIVESELWAIVTQGACNVSYSFAWFFLLRVPGIREGLQSPIAVWSRPILLMLAVEIAAIVLAIGLTFYFQSRKRDFI